MKKIKSQVFARWLIYILGMAVLALGIVLNTKSGLGVSPIISVPYAVSEILNIPALTFANTTQVWYTVFILSEVIIHILLYLRNRNTDKAPKGPTTKLPVTLLQDVLQLPVSILVTRFIALFSGYIPACTESGNAFYSGWGGRILILVCGIILTGVGIGLSLNMRLVPNPGDGIVQALADCIGRKVGTAKNIFDIMCVCLSVSVSLIFAHKLIGIHVGTVLAMIFVGRTVAVFNRLFRKKILHAAGLDDPTENKSEK